MRNLFTPAQHKEYKDLCFRVTCCRTRESLNKWTQTLRGFLESFPNPEIMNAHSEYAIAFSKVSTAHYPLPSFNDDDGSQENIAVDRENSDDQGIVIDDTENTLAMDEPSASSTITGYFDIVNPTRFELPRIRNLLRQYPNCSVAGMEVVVEDNHIIRAVMTLHDGPVDNVLIIDHSIFSRMGLGEDMGNNFTKIYWSETENKIVPSMVLRIHTEQVEEGNKMGFLEVPRHSYLHWLNLRRRQFPHSPPTEEECYDLAKKLGYMDMEDLKKELMDVWDRENGPLRYKENRALWLGDNPTYLLP
ncbi:hypothetical protein P280DRAFT_523143 [Massarina eburnea CBS 473.64]|uniref:Uncharacterized protein n=1 Tax=Massarina eburnea CBS 473.64 TaxID=1395130 RepID=A0A6A6RIQ3_9PLEO|nr:hypothetical protein P280DRAFT_523143 [Massarina eburnea CBS 473.64]